MKEIMLAGLNPSPNQRVTVSPESIPAVMTVIGVMIKRADEGMLREMRTGAHLGSPAEAGQFRYWRSIASGLRTLMKTIKHGFKRDEIKCAYDIAEIDILDALGIDRELILQQSEGEYHVAGSTGGSVGGSGGGRAGRIPPGQKSVDN